MRSVSKFGFSQVVVTFKDGTDIYFARQLVNERLSTVDLSSEIDGPRWDRFRRARRGVALRGHRQGDDVTELRTIQTGSSSRRCAP